MAAFRDDMPLVVGVNEDWDEKTTRAQIVRPDWDFSPIRMKTMHHLALVRRTQRRAQRTTEDSSHQPPAAGLMTQHQDAYYIPPPRVVGGARGNSAPVSTATLGLIHRQDPSLAAQLREDPGSMMTQSTRRRVYSTMQDWHVGPVGFPPTMGRGDASPR